MTNWQRDGDSWSAGNFIIFESAETDGRFTYLLTRRGGGVPESFGQFDSLAAAQAAAETKK
jgi:hypothetical protein